MPGQKSNREVEIKLRVPDEGALRLRLKQLRARQVVPRTFESNTLYDTPSRSLTRRGRLIRLRIEQPSAISHKNTGKATTDVVLTFKGPPGSLRSSRNSARRANRRSHFKIREEVEVVVGDGDQMSRILRALGFEPVFRYEKFRTTYALPGLPRLKLEFDETPVGVFMELEGTPSSIERAAGLLGYSGSDYITQSYGALYIADCRRRGRKPSNMLFQPTEILH